MVDAAFPQVNSQCSESYASDDNKRNELRANKSLTFAAGTSTLPEGTLKKYLKDCTLSVTQVVGEPPSYYAYRAEYADFIRDNDLRLGYWTTNSNTIYANTPATIGIGVIPYVGAATFTCIVSPDIPLTETDVFDAPADYIPDFIDAFMLFILGQTTMTAAATVT